MDYYDGNTVTALWNYAQHYALNDNFYNTTFGPSSPGPCQPDLRSNPWRHTAIHAGRQAVPGR